MKGITIDDLPPAYRAQVERQLKPTSSGVSNRTPNPPASDPIPDSPATQAKKPNKTEARYNTERLNGQGRYEALTFRLPGASRYTPDWVVIHPDGRTELHEVKGTYRLGSHGRARTAFCEAAAAFPMFRFLWAERLENGGWTQKEWRKA